MADNIVSLLEWKANHKRKEWFYYPVEIISYENGIPVWRFELVEAMPLEPKVEPLD